MGRLKRCVWLALLAGATMFAFAVSNANAAETGSITGTLTDGDGNPVWSACVDAYDQAGTPVSSAHSNSSGKYVLGSLATGNYRVEFRSCSENVIGEFYDDKKTLAEATPVSVNDGAETPGINAQLATGGSISGVVTYPADGPRDDVCIDAFDSNGTRASYSRTEDDGRYTVGGLETGQYRLEFSACSTIGPNLAPEFYNDKTKLSEATPVAVNTGEDTEGINVELAVGGSISGVASGYGIFAPYYCLVHVTAFDSDGNAAGTDSVGFSSGDYRIEQLGTGQYRLQFVRGCANPSTNPMTSLPPVTRYYSGQKTLATATPVGVTAGSETSAINESAEPGSFDSVISGTVKDMFGVPQSKLCVQAFDSAGEIFRSVLTSPFGDYRIAQLQADDYRLKVSNCLELREYPVTPEFFNDKETLAAATVIEVRENVTVPGVNFEVETGGTDTSAPDTKIYTGPEGTITQGQATFDFYSTDPHDTTRIQCRIDAEPFADCVTPVTFSKLGPGSHTAGFRAEDVAGNVDQTPATRTFNVELTRDWATIGQVGVVGPVNVKKGKEARYSVTITNAGNTSATGVKIAVKGKGVSYRTNVKPVSSGASRTIRINLAPKKRGRVKLVFKVTSANAGNRKVAQIITVR